MFLLAILIFLGASASAKINPSMNNPSVVYSPEHFYSPNTFLKELRPLPPNQLNSRILNQGIQAQTSLSETESFPTLSLKGMEVVKQLADAMETLWYQPVVVLVDDSKEVYRDAALFIRSLLRMPQVQVAFWLMKFNSTGVTRVIADTYTDKEGFFDLLKWTNQSLTSNLITPEILQNGVTFYGILQATRQLIDEAGIIVFTDRRPEDEDLAPLAIKELIEKNITLYVVWEGAFPTLKNEDALLRKAAFFSKGDFLIGNTERKLSELYCNYYVINDDAKEARNIIALYTNITGRKQFKFPVDTDVRNIHVGITSSVEAAKLTSPEGFAIDILNNTHVGHFSKGSFSTYASGLDQYEILLNTAGSVPTPIVGIWRLDVDVGGLNAQDCNITISIQTHLNVTTTIAYKTRNDIVSEWELQKVLRVVLTGGLTELNNITFLDERGLPIHQNVLYSVPNKNKESLLDTEDTDRIPQHQTDIDFNSLPKGPFYLRIVGQDKDGRAFSRLSYYDTQKLNYLIQPLAVEVGAGSELLVRPQQYGKIFFEVTNNRDQVVYLYFMVQDERSHLSRMEPRSSWVNPKQTIIVTVTTYASSPATASYRNLVTFTVSGPEKVQKSAAMYVSSTPLNDDTDPRMWHRYTSDCTDILLGKCEDGSWVIEVTADDRESGLLQLTSSPKGLNFPNGYISGTKEPVVGLYGGSCCNSKIQLTAIDLQNNRRSYTADAYKAALSPGSISAIVLGIILFIIILVALICVCKKKVCKDKESVDLPTYRGPHGSQSRY